MAEQKSLTEIELSTPDDAQELSFSPQNIRVEMSFFLKQNPHKLPKPSVDFLLGHFAKLVKQDREDKSLQAVLMELVIIALKNPSGANSPRYIAIADFARTKGVTIEEFVPAAAPDAAAPIAEQTADAVAAINGEKTERPTVDFSSEEISSSVRGKFADIMNMEPADSIRALFPSIPDMVLQAVLLKIKQGATPEESHDVNWHVNFFADLVQSFPSLAEDLTKQGITLQSAARALVARGQKEANRSAVERAERLKGRGQMATIQGIHVSELQTTIAMEVALAGTRQSAQETSVSPAEDAATQAATDLPKQDDSPAAAPLGVSSLEDLRPAAIAVPAVEEKPEEIATIQVDTRAVRGLLPTVPQMEAYVPPEAIGSEVPLPVESEDSFDDRSQRLTMPAPEELTAAPEKPKKKRGKGLISKIFGGGNKEE